MTMRQNGNFAIYTLMMLSTIINVLLSTRGMLKIIDSTKLTKPDHVCYQIKKSFLIEM